jgi:NAD+ kinase
MKKIGILYHPKVEATRDKAEELEAFLKNKGVQAWTCSAWEKDLACAKLDGTDLVLTVGGDGTILRAIQAVVPSATPITGINLGKLGFMTELGADEARDVLPEILAGVGWIDERSMLRAELGPQKFEALNDVVMARGDIARLIRVEASIDGQPLATYRADGVVMATATGSTGYALAAGGPILYPDSRDMVLVPVAPHLGLSRALVVRETSVVTLRLGSYLTATLSIDGHINLSLADGDTVIVKKSQYTARFLRIRPREAFYSSLEDRLKGNKGCTT